MFVHNAQRHVCAHMLFGFGGGWVVDDLGSFCSHCTWAPSHFWVNYELYISNIQFIIYSLAKIQSCNREMIPNTAVHLQQNGWRRKVSSCCNDFAMVKVQTYTQLILKESCIHIHKPPLTAQVGQNSFTAMWEVDKVIQKMLMLLYPVEDTWVHGSLSKQSTCVWCTTIARAWAT